MKNDIRDIERMLKALANKRRLLILKCLYNVKRAIVGDIAKEIKLSFKATSKHLIILAAANLIEKEQISLMMEYRLSDSLPAFAKSIIGNL